MYICDLYDGIGFVAPMLGALVKTHLPVSLEFMFIDIHMF